MALPQSWIGAYRFLSLAGLPSVPRTEVEVRAREGIDGNWISLLGVKSRPFQVFSEVDALSIADAHLAAINYSNLIGTAPQVVICQGVNYFTSHSLKFLVLDVEVMEPQPMLGMVGGLFPPSLALLQARWTLLAVEVV